MLNTTNPIAAVRKRMRDAFAADPPTRRSTH